jgi:tRNA(fMet)-specific endonuclease VapC
VEVKKILLDTNAYTRLLSGDKSVLGALGQADTVYMSVIVLGELFAGFRAGKRERKNRGLLDDFLTRPTVKILNVTQETAEVFGSVKQGLKARGKPVPINDAWIAAHALETGSTLLTSDEHFEAVPGLRRWEPTDA